MSVQTLTSVNFLQGTSSSVIYVDPDAYNRNCTILRTLLPRESSSKVRCFSKRTFEIFQLFLTIFYFFFHVQETDAALLCVTGYPAFAVDDDKLRETTGERIIENLMVQLGLIDKTMVSCW